MEKDVEIAIKQGSESNLQHYLETYGIPAVTALVVIIAAFMLAKLLSRLILSSCAKKNIDPTLARFFAKVARWAVLLVAVIISVGIVGIPTASFAVLIGSLGLAIGLAFQGTLANFASGIMLIIFRPFKIGDVVRIGGEIGKVAEVELFTTVLDTPDNRRIILPNGTVFGATIENVTHHSTRRVDVAVGVDYAADLDKTREVLDKAAREIPGRLTDQDPAIVLSDLGDSSVNWKVRVWSSTADYWDVRDAATRAVKVALDNAGIGIPFPQMDVHLDKQS